MSLGLDGLKSDAVRAALEAALAGQAHALVDLLGRHGGMPRPNLKLAAAFAVELAQRSGTLAPFLNLLASEDAAPDMPRAFLPVAAAHAFLQRLAAGREVEPSWVAVRELAADPRGPVRLGVLGGLRDFVLREGAPDQLIARATGWLEDDDRERQFSAAGLVIETFAESRVFGLVREPEALLDYLSRVIVLIADAPRAAARSDGRRRALVSLPATVAAAVAQVRGNDRGFAWFREECERATHPDIRAALSKALLELRKVPQSPGIASIDTLRQALEASAKPIRDHARVRPGHGQGRGRRSRPTR